MKNYNDFCKEKGCEYYREWDYDFGYGPYPCASCERVGQSHDINEYPHDCIHLDEIQKIKLET